MKLFIRRLRGLCEQIIAPSYSTCKRCWRPWKFIESHTVSNGPGTGYFEYCEQCWVELPKELQPTDWEESIGLKSIVNPNAKFLRYIGKPYVTSSRHGLNAYGSLLAELDDGSHVGIICGHGGSCWLCLECAQKIYKESKGKSS